MQQSLVIGFGHKARAGKDTVAKAILDARGHKYDIRIAGFADELKREVANLDIADWCVKHNVPYDTTRPLGDPLCPLPHGKQSAFLQWYGTEYKRASNKFYWVNKMRDWLEKEKPQIVLIPDLRFRNEFFFIRSLGGFNVKVARPGYVDAYRSSYHISETELDNTTFDIEISRITGDLEGLKEDAVRAFDTILDWVSPAFDTDFTVEGLEKDCSILEPQQV